MGESIETAVYAKESTTPSDVVLVVVPGNPGVIDFYVPFIDILFENLERKCSIYGSL